MNLVSQVSDNRPIVSILDGAEAKDLVAEVFNIAEVVAKILSCLDTREQPQAAIVCKGWYSIALDPALHYGRRAAIRSLACRQSHNTFFSLAKAPLHSISGNTALFFKNSGGGLIMRNLSSGAEKIVDTAAQPVSAVFCPPATLAILTADRQIQLWNTHDKTPCFTQKIDSNLEGSRVVGGAVICVETEHNWEIFNPKSRSLQIKERIQRAGVVGYASDKELIGSCYCVRGGEGPTHQSSFAVIGIKEPQPRWVQLLGREEWFEGMYCGVVGANDQVVVVARAGDHQSVWSPATYEMRFYVLDKKSGAVIAEIVEDYSIYKESHAQFAQNGRLTCEKFSWLSGDFLAVWVRQKVHIWCISSKDLCAVINVPGFFPVFHVEVSAKEIKIAIRHIGRDVLRWIQFSADAPIDSCAVRQMQAMPLRVAEKSWKEIATRIHNQLSRRPAALWHSLSNVFLAERRDDG